jgi:hypothetical protein
MSPALVSGAAIAFIALLVVLLALMLAAVIRAPGQNGSAPEEAGDDTRPLPAVPTAARPVPMPFRPKDAQARDADAQARAAAVIVRAAAVLSPRPAPDPQPTDAAVMPAGTGGQAGNRHYPARHVAGTFPRPPVTGGPPWAPAPKPPDIPYTVGPGHGRSGRD